MRRREYFAVLNEWKKRYGGPNKRKTLDLTKVKVKCIKCKKVRKKMHRHHKGNDFLWASLHPDTFAARYIQFHEEDIAHLCGNCHKKIHALYDTILYNFWLDWAAERTDNVSHRPSIEECKEYQRLCTEEFERWMRAG